MASQGNSTGTTGPLVGFSTAPASAYVFLLLWVAPTGPVVADQWCDFASWAFLLASQGDSTGTTGPLLGFLVAWCRQHQNRCISLEMNFLKIF